VTIIAAVWSYHQESIFSLAGLAQSRIHPVNAAHAAVPGGAGSVARRQFYFKQALFSLAGDLSEVRMLGFIHQSALILANLIPIRED
jgi:hypothetical protein